MKKQKKNLDFLKETEKARAIRLQETQAGAKIVSKTWDSRKVIQVERKHWKAKKD